MIEVTKHGNCIKTNVCSNCGCKFNYTLDELKCLKDIKNGERVSCFWYVECPECKNKLETMSLEEIMNFYIDNVLVCDDKTDEKEIVYIDMDGVIVDFNSGKKHFTNEDYEKAGCEWDNVEGIYSKMTPVDGAIDAVKRICKKYDVYILSTAPWNNPSAWSDKVMWIQRYFGNEAGFPLYKRLILTHHKDLCTGNYLIDDNKEKNGVPNFKGELIHFGSKQYPNWDSVLEKLGC